MKKSNAVCRPASFESLLKAQHCQKSCTGVVIRKQDADVNGMVTPVDEWLWKYVCMCDGEMFN